MSILGFLLTALGVLLLLPSLAGVALGLYMASSPRTRGQGLFFALWWTPAAAASAGVVMHDPVTFLVGVFCFVIAGAALIIERGSGGRKSQRGSRGGSEVERPARNQGGLSRLSERTTQRRIRADKRRREAAS